MPVKPVEVHCEKIKVYSLKIDATLGRIPRHCSFSSWDAPLARWRSLHDKCCDRGKQLNTSASFDSPQSVKTRPDFEKNLRTAAACQFISRRKPGGLLNKAADVFKVSKHFQRLRKLNCCLLRKPNFHTRAQAAAKHGFNKNHTDAF